MSKKVIVLNMVGKFIRLFPSLKSCADAEGERYDVISRNLRNGTLNDRTLHFYDYAVDEVDYGKQR